MITSSTRQGFYFLFIILLMFTSQFLGWFGFYEAFVIIALAGIVLKLTDIEEAINGSR